MTLEEYFDFKKKFEAEAVKQLTKNQDLIDVGEKDYEKYTQRYMANITQFSGDIQSYSMSELRETIAEIEANTDRFKNCPEFNIRIEATAYNDYDSAFIDEVYVAASWYYPKDYEDFIKSWQLLFRTELGQMLKPKDKNYPLPVDCKTLQMFEEEELTWKGIQKITYGTCDI